MANTKKVLEEDVTKAQQAKTAEDVNNQSARERLWQSLSTTYTNQMEESDKAYDKAISQQDNAQLARGMGRSSYAGQIRANMYNDKNTARNKLGEALIADYQNRIGEIEAQEKEDEWKQKQFDESVRQFNEGQALTREQAELNRAFQTSERKAQQAFTTSERTAQQAYNTSERMAQQNWQAQQAQLNRDAELALQKLNQLFTATQNELSRQAQKDLQILSQNWQSSEAEKNRAAQEALQRLSQEFTSGENAKNREAQEALQRLSQAFTAEQNALNRQQSQSQFEIQQAFAEKQWQAQQEQWKEQFEYTKMSDSQKLAFNYCMTLIENGETPSDLLLKRAGITGADAAQMVNARTVMAERNASRGNSTPEWARNGFTSEAEYKEALDAGYKTKAEWDKHNNDMKNKVYGNSNSSNVLNSVLYGFGKSAGYTSELAK